MQIEAIERVELAGAHSSRPPDPFKVHLVRAKDEERGGGDLYQYFIYPSVHPRDYLYSSGARDLEQKKSLTRGGLIGKLILCSSLQ